MVPHVSSVTATIPAHYLAPVKLRLGSAPASQVSLDAAVTAVTILLQKLPSVVVKVRNTP